MYQLLTLEAYQKLKLMSEDLAKKKTPGPLITAHSHNLIFMYFLKSFQHHLSFTPLEVVC